jgi:acetyl-CoA carboxylase carboxyl transferase subunit beta
MALMPKFGKKSRNTLESNVTEVPVEVPERRLYLKCPGCARVVDVEEAAANLDVCPHCGHHMRLGARRRIEITADPGSFAEWDADLAATDFLGFPGYAGKLESARAKSGETDAVVCGRARIEGIDCALFVMSGDFMMGSMGAVVGEKIARCFEHAGELGLPVVGFTVSGGARMQEGTTSLMQMAKVSAAVRRFGDGGGLYVTVLTDPTSGGVTASFAMEGDVILAEPKALVAFAGPRVIEQTIHRKLPAGFQSAEFQLEHGFVDRIVERADLRDELGLLLALHRTGGQTSAWTGPERARDGRGGAAAALVEAVGGAVQSVAGGVAAVAKDVTSRAGSSDTAEDAEVPAGAPTPFERVRNARSADRPTALALIEGIFDDFVELHGDRSFKDDAAVVGGVASLGGRPVTVIGTERGTNLKERVTRNFGSAHPEGYRKALRLMQQAEKFGRPVVCLIDTSGAYCGIEAEERGQGQAIAQNLVAMAGLATPVVSVVIGEGGSGGALGLGVADRVWMLENAVYSVISPEGCASILYKDSAKAPEAAAALGLTADDLLRLGIIDAIVPEGDGSAAAVSRELGAQLATTLDELAALPGDELLDRRYAKFRGMGVQTICSRS